MKFIIKNIKYFIIIGSILISMVFSCFFSYENNEVINVSTILNIVITLFTVLLAIIALLITILDKYREKVDDQERWAEHSSNVLKALCENTIALLFLILILIITSMFETTIDFIPFLNVRAIILLTVIILAMTITFDTTITIYILVVALKDWLTKDNTRNLELSKEEKHIVEAYRYFNEKYKLELTEYIKSLSIRQELDKKH